MSPKRTRSSEQAEDERALREKAREKAQEKALWAYRLLLERYGERELKPRREPMHELISTILSQRTTWQNEARAYERMWARFGSWEAVRDAPVSELEGAIAPSNYPEVKAPQIQKTVAEVLKKGRDANLDFLRELPLEDALAWLTALPGVGVKTASLVLLFCFSKPILPVDTHVYRVSARIGLLNAGVKTPTAAHGPLLELLPAEPHLLYNFHIALLLHGQQVCVWREPHCARCPLTSRCNWFRAHHLSGDA